jgi:hypothetical protein
MIAAVDHTGSASVNRSKIWNVFARLPALSAVSDTVIHEIISHYVRLSRWVMFAGWQRHFAAGIRPKQRQPGGDPIARRDRRQG